MGAFLIDIHHENHRLLHAVLKPPHVPEHQILVDMRNLAVKGLESVLEGLNHPIVEHIDRQLTIVRLDPEEAQFKLDTGDYKIES